MKKATRYFLILCIFFGVIFVASCGQKTYLGSSETGFEHFPKDNNISPYTAFELANPFVEYSYNLRKKNRSKEFNIKGVPVDYVVLKGSLYYVTRDTYKSKKPSFYISYAIKVNKDTGQIIKPLPYEQ